MPRIKVTKGRGSPMVMHKDENTRELKTRIKWLLDFLNMDMDLLNRVGSLKLFLDLLAFMYGPAYELFSSELYPEIVLRSETDLAKERKFLKTCQDYLRSRLTEIIEGGKMGKELGDVFPLPSDRYEVSYRDFIFKDRIYKIPIHDGPLTFPEDLKAHGENEANYKGLLRDSLIRVLAPFPISRIKICEKPGCGNYFYQKTIKSKGDLCSPKCKNWARTNRWRKANPEKYNAYHRNRRAKAKEDRVEVKCRSCEFQQSIGSIKDLIRGILTDMRKCPNCGTMLLHIPLNWENGKWVEGEPFGGFEWEEFLEEYCKNETQIEEG